MAAIVSYPGDLFLKAVHRMGKLSEEGFIVAILTTTVLMGTLAYGNHLLHKSASRDFEASCQKMHPPLREILLTALKIQLSFALVIGSLVGIFAWLSCPIPYGIVGLISLFIFVVSFPFARDELILKRIGGIPR
jgi:hypothetical protein